MENVIKYMLTDQCNSSCAYCPYKDKLFNGSMSEEDISRTFDKIWPAYKGFAYIHLFGGEPLLCINIIRYLDKLVRKWCKNVGVDRPRYILSTNLMKLDDGMMSMIKDTLNNPILVISVDGDKEHHDKYRMDNSYDRILMNAARLKQHGIQIYNITCVYHKHFVDHNITPFDLALTLTRHFKPISITFNLIQTRDESYHLSYSDFYKLQLESINKALANIHNEDAAIASASTALLYNDLSTINRKQEHFCDYGINSISVFPHGLVDICPDLFLFGQANHININSTDYDALIRSVRDKAKRENYIVGIPECRDCAARNICKKCLYWDSDRMKEYCAFSKSRHSMLCNYVADGTTAIL